MRALRSAGLLGLLVALSHHAAVAAPSEGAPSPAASRREPEARDRDPPAIAPLRECLSAFGGSLAHWRTPQAVPVGHVMLGTLRHTSYIAHPYVHEVYASPDGREFFVIEIGGIAKTRRVFGPIASDRPCELPPAAAQPATSRRRVVPVQGDKVQAVGEPKH